MIIVGSQKRNVLLVDLDIPSSQHHIAEQEQFARRDTSELPNLGSAIPTSHLAGKRSGFFGYWVVRFGGK